MDLLDRLFHRLSEAVAGAHGPTSPASLTVGEVYQHLVPYRGVRSELGMWELAQYEHTLLRLLSGEREYLRVEDPDVEAELRRELSSPNPILGIYRDYAAVSVRILDPVAVRMPGAGAGDAAADGTGPVALPAPPASTPAQLATEEAEAALDPEPLPELRPRAGCRSCSEPLPEVSDLRFCPSCGIDQTEVPCAACGTSLREEWNFCIRCGRPRHGVAARG